MPKQILHRLFFTLLFASSSLLVVTMQSRLMQPASMVDIRYWAEKAPLVFRAHVLTVTPASTNADPATLVPSIAQIQIDRWYRGTGPAQASLRFSYSPGNVGLMGHDCIDFQPETYWLVFAIGNDGQLEMIDDCEGALTISSRLGPDLHATDWPSQMEADFLAGLNDPDSAARLASIQRLGGLKLSSSRDALHRVIEQGDPTESKWAVYAALRTGDVSVLPRVKQLLANGVRELPQSAIVLELQHVNDPAALPDLVSILNSATDDLTRGCVLAALSEHFNDPRAVPTLAAHLSDSDSAARYNALNGLKNITREEACTLPHDWTEQDVQPQISRCKLWWDQTGQLQHWPQN
jgi:HEAT repeat protein